MMRKQAARGAMALATAVVFVFGCYRLRGPLDWGSDDTSGRDGRTRVAKALDPPRSPPVPAALSGNISTALSSAELSPGQLAKGFDPTEDHLDRAFELELRDGTRVGGLFFPLDGAAPAPLLIASFGYLQDRWGTEPAKFYEQYIEDAEERIPAHVLLLDHPTAGSFAAVNGHASVGSYDDGRMWIEVARHLRERLRPSAIHLYGVSMSGQTVVHALLEDARLGAGLFASGMAVSIAPDFRDVPGMQLAGIETSGPNPWAESFASRGREHDGNRIQSEAIWMLVKNQFEPSYRAIDGVDFEIEKSEAPLEFRRLYDRRIAFLRRHRGEWNAAFRLDSLEDYMATTRIADVIGAVRTPLVLVNAHNDPSVPHELFAEVVRAAEGNPWVVARETDYGGHNGFDVPYGADYLGRAIRLMLDPAVVAKWDARAKP